MLKQNVRVSKWVDRRGDCVMMTRHVSCDEELEMTEDEYTLFLERFEKRGYSNHADMGSDGVPVDVFDNIIAGMRLIEKLDVGDSCR